MTADEAMRQAVMTAEDYFAAAVRNIDKRFGDGYAAQHPELIVGFMRAASLDYHSWVMGHQFPQTITETWADIFWDCMVWNPMGGGQ